MTLAKIKMSQLKKCDVDRITKDEITSLTDFENI